jgi:hypothetical protein
MTHYINLYDPALMRQRQWLTAANLLFAVAAIFFVMLLWGAWARIQAGSLADEAASLDERTRTAREESVALASQIASRKPDPKLELDVAAAKELLGMREGILGALGQGAVSDSVGYADYLRGLARQSVSGLWLTGFSVGPDGGRMEIRGRTLDPALLPEYIRRLNAEPAFRGHRFAALSVAVPPPPPGATPDTAESAAPKFLEFALVPEVEPERAGARP